MLKNIPLKLSEENSVSENRKERAGDLRVKAGKDGIELGEIKELQRNEIQI